MSAKWWKDRDNWVPEHLIKIPPRQNHEKEEEQSPPEDIGDVADDDSDEFDDVEPPDRGLDN